MPTYVYECKKCSKTIEADQRMADPPLKNCACGGRGTLRRIIQPTAVMFKGSGFHINDYKGDTKKAEAPEPCGPECACEPPKDSS